jgi:hypothetical protein
MGNNMVCVESEEGGKSPNDDFWMVSTRQQWDLAGKFGDVNDVHGL